MKSPLVLLALVLLGPVLAVAAPGDPRLVSGVLEWPRAVTVEPFVVVRADDGALYYAGIATARREGALIAGARVSLLGLEGRTPHEITALGVGAGASAEAALAHLQGARSAPAALPSAAATPPPTRVVSGGAAVAAPTPAAVPAAPAPAAAAPATPAPPAAATPPAPAAVPAVAAPVPAAVATVATPPAAITPVPAAPPAVAGATPSAPTRAVVYAGPAVEDRRWSEVTGVVESLAGRTLVLRSDDGRVSVDVSSLSENLDRMVTPGATVKVYGVPVELRFKAMGFFDPGARR